MTPIENQKTADCPRSAGGVMFLMLARYMKPLGKMHVFMRGRLYALAPDLTFFLSLGL